MHVISRKTLLLYWDAHRAVEEPLKAWYKEAEHSNWDSFADIKKRYPTASSLPHNRVVFNIKGNSYRLVVKINYPMRTVFIRFIGTHAEYDRIDAETI